MAATARVVNLEGIRDQKRELWRPVLEQTGDPEILHALSTIVRAMPDEEQRDDRKLARAIQQFVQTNIRFLKEHPERYQTPTRTLRWRIGDCDDQAPLTSTLMRSCKIASRLCIAGWGVGPNDEPEWRHIYNQSLLPNDNGELCWVTTETVRRVPLGFDPCSWMASRGFHTRRTYVGDRGPL